MDQVIKKSVFDQVMDSVIAHIHDNELHAGDKMPTEEEIASKLGVGRNSVREALKSLQAMGILEVRRGEGTFLKPFDFDTTLSNLSIGYMLGETDLSDITRVRCALELGFIADVCCSITQERLTRLRKISIEIESSIDNPKEYFALDAQFHKILFESADCSLLDKLLSVFWAMLEGYIPAGYPSDKEILLESIREHNQIVDCVAHNDIEQSQRILMKHFADKEQLLQSIFKERNSHEVSEV